jgi:hypothetical protein
VKSKLKPGARRNSVGSAWAVRQSRVRFSAGHEGSSLAERRSDEDTRRQASANDEERMYIGTVLMIVKNNKY